MIQSVPSHLMVWTVWLPIELLPFRLLMILLTKAERWILKRLGLYYLLKVSQMLKNSLDGTSHWKWTRTQSKLWKQSKVKKWNAVQWSKSVPDMTQITHVFQLLTATRPKNKQELKTDAVKTWQSMTREETQHLVNVYGFQTPGSLWLQRQCIQILKMTISDRSDFNLLRSHLCCCIQVRPCASSVFLPSILTLKSHQKSLASKIYEQLMSFDTHSVGKTRTAWE